MVDYAIVAAEVLPVGTPVTDQRLVGTGLTVVQGETLYIDPTTDTWLKGSASSTIEAAQVTHIALNGGSQGQPVDAALIQRGLVLDLGATAAIPATALVVQSANAGRQAPAADLTTGNYSTYLGTGIGNNQVLYNVNASGIQVP